MCGVVAAVAAGAELGTVRMQAPAAKAYRLGGRAEVERNMLTITITRYGRPIARVVPIERKERSFAPIPGVAGKIKINCDLFADGSSKKALTWNCR